MDPISAFMPAPTTCDELFTRAQQLAGHTLADLAAPWGLTVPEDPVHCKGWIGQLLEKLLGASAGSQAEPDFPALGIELKTIPINRQGKPQESTYITTTPLLTAPSCFTQSSVYRKLKHVLWLPVEAAPKALAMRRVGNPLLWQADAAFLSILAQDWEELTEQIICGHIESLSAQQGRYLHIRPKASNASALCWGINAQGEKIRTLPRGYYLRSHVTANILQIAVG